MENNNVITLTLPMDSRKFECTWKTFISANEFDEEQLSILAKRLDERGVVYMRRYEIYKNA